MFLLTIKLKFALFNKNCIFLLLFYLNLHFKFYMETKSTDLRNKHFYTHHKFLSLLPN
jgi:hypothetical protein